MSLTPTSTTLCTNNNNHVFIYKHSPLLKMLSGWLSAVSGWHSDQLILSAVGLGVVIQIQITLEALVGIIPPAAIQMAPQTWPEI